MNASKSGDHAVESKHVSKLSLRIDVFDERVAAHLQVGVRAPS